VALYQLWTAIQRHPDALKDAVRRVSPTADEFHRVKEQFLASPSPPLSDEALVQLACDKIALHQLSFGHFGTMSGPRGGSNQASGGIAGRWNPARICERIDVIAGLLPNARLTNVDFEQVIDDDAPRATIYCDPPYAEAGKHFYRHLFSEQDHIRLRGALRRTPHNWLLSYDDAEMVWDLYSGFAAIERVPVDYGSRSKKGRETYELLISPLSDSLKKVIPTSCHPDKATRDSGVRAPSAAVTSLLNKIDRIYADVPLPEVLETRIASMRERNLRIVELESQKKQIKKVLLCEVLDFASELQATVDQHSLSVAEVARRANIAERDAQRLYKLPVDAIRQEIAAGEREYGEAYRYPSWRTLVPGHKLVSDCDAAPGGTTHIYDGGGRHIAEASASDVAVSQTKLVLLADVAAELEAARKEIADLKAIAPPSYYARHFRGGNDDRPTPQYISDWLKERFGAFDLDVCADALNAKAPRHFDKDTDALKQQWLCDNGFMNPPFSKITALCCKAHEETRSGRAKRIVALLPSYVNNAWFHDFVWHARLYLPRNRITFEGMKAGAPFGSVIAVWEHGYHNSTDSLTFTRIAMPKAPKVNKR
jgi:phage N-6-adenine-methyltransferase